MWRGVARCGEVWRGVARRLFECAGTREEGIRLLMSSH